MLSEHFNLQEFQMEFPRLHKIIQTIKKEKKENYPFIKDFALSDLS